MTLTSVWSLMNRALISYMSTVEDTRTSL